MTDYLPPVVVKITSEFDPKGLAEAKAALDEFKRQQAKTFGDTGRESGKAMGDALPGGAQPGLDRLEKLVRDAGKKSGSGWVDEFKKAARQGDADALGTLVKGLEPAFRKAGKDGGTTLFRELSKALGPSGMESDVGRQLVSTFGELGKAGSAEFGTVFKGGFVSGLGELAAAASPALVPMGIGLASELLAAMGGVIEGAAGLGGIITGALVQIKSNPEVAGAAKTFGRWLTGEFTADTAPFAKPLEDAFAILKTDLSGPLADLRKDFSYLAPWVREFAMYLGAAAEQFMPGFNRAVQSSGPVLRELGKDVATVAGGFSTFFDQTSKGTKGEVESLHALAAVVAGTIGYFGFLIRAGADGYDMLLKFDKGFMSVLSHVTVVGALLEHFFHVSKYINDLGGSFDDSAPKVDNFAKSLSATASDANLTADDLSKLSGQISATATTADTLAGEMSKKLFDSVMSIDQATLGWHQSLTGLSDTLAQNGRAIDKHTGQLNLNTKQGQADEQAILNAVQANMQSYQAFIAAGGSASDAARQYDTNTAALERQLQKAGYTKDQIDGLIGKYKGIPDIVDTTIATHGLTDAIDNLADLISKLNNISTPRTVVIDEINRINTNMGHLAAGGVVGEYTGMVTAIRAASGLNSGVLPPRSPGTLVLAGEPGTKGEVFAPLAGISQQRAMSLAQVIGNAYGFDVVSRGGLSPAIVAAVAGGSGGGFRSGGGDGQVIEVVVHTPPITLDGRVLHAGLIGPAQRYKIRTGTTGLS